LARGVGVQEGAKTVDVFETFSLWESNGASGKIEGIAHIVLYVSKVGSFAFVPGYVDGTDIVLCWLDIVAVPEGNAIGGADERSFWIWDSNDKEVVDPFPCGTDVRMVPDVHSSIGHFPLDTGCGGCTERKIMIYIEKIMETHHQVAFVIRCKES
jgi:hypothetical protein